MQLRKRAITCNGQKFEAKLIIEKLLLEEDLSTWNKQVAKK
ncbi:MAG: hypothetical protein CM15mP87_07040 [Candidatus Neomarinimicrobiota bacterium]|nr:MAG: hypothetical protein CM15mP87_07040 [Candidatus Neomarinimicrobiota bacterium]